VVFWHKDVIFSGKDIKLYSPEGWRKFKRTGFSHTASHCTPSTHECKEASRRKQRCNPEVTIMDAVPFLRPSVDILSMKKNQNTALTKSNAHKFDEE